ncbi:ARM repeat-containing protein [Annulohypoxylon truncatum]|uniref:ARM repeat-containing protein n=1 Tax=Annulohypoxylon truncatum TaxID=327061 RepID=UPI002007FF95|nr:ARM repeat-containing protein [Annulohypoxylon truncatum]KAI1209828.1 ARM repeat-containing protein [Annulohypoxylon truncatum]
MEDQLVQVLANTQLPAEGPRKQAEIDLKHAASNPAYPLSLANIARHSSIATDVRQSALSALRLFIERNWSGEGDDFPVVPIADSVKDQIRPMLLDLALNSDDKKIKTAASYAVGKIANVDFPDQWTALLPTLLEIIPNGTDNQLHGALIVLRDLVDESLSDDQFFSMAQDIVKVVYDVAINEGRKPALRALAVSVFRGCFDLMDTVKEEHLKEVQGFAEEAMKGWFPFFHQSMKLQLPGLDSQEASQPESWNGTIALKLQVVKCLLKLKVVFPSLLLPETPQFFQVVWEELRLLAPSHEKMYILNDSQGRLEDSDGIPYTLDFLVLEELDFLNGCIRAPPVRKELEAQLAAHSSAGETPWVLDLMMITSSYARITREEEDLWDIDVSLYLAEEASVSANYTPRTACGDIMIKLGEWLNHQVLEGLYGFTKGVFSEEGAWRRQEACLYLLNQLMNDFLDCSKVVTPEVSQAYLELINYAINRPDEPLLRARGYLVAGVLAQFNGTAAALTDRTMEAITAEDSELVQVACIKAIEGFLRGGNAAGNQQIQAKVVNSIQQWMSTRDMAELEEADDLLITLTETLRSAINIDKRVAVVNDVPALDMLFLIAKHGSTNWQVTMLICEEFEDIVRTLPDPVSYQALCQKVLPSLTGAFNVADITSDNPLITFATELMASLTQYASEPLPPGFVAATLPKLSRLLMESNEGDILRPGAESVKYLLAHDHEQVLNYHDENNRSGLEVCLHIIDRLLGPSIEDNAASEVGGLAAELVEKAGHERLGPFLPQLLQAVANRLATAEAAPFIQSLILVFARLSLVGASDVVEFLSTIQINGDSGLRVVLSKWLENSVNFAGYDEIRQNVIALSKLYSLNDARVTQTLVRGDLIMPTSDRIMTRSRSKQTPDQYTIVAAPLKILKVLIEELLSASGVGGAANAAAAAAAEFADDNDDDGWEDDPDTIDLNLGSVKNDLMGFLEASNMRSRDDETQAYLTEFFLRAAHENIAGFQDWYNQLSENEKAKLQEISPAQ